MNPVTAKAEVIPNTKILSSNAMVKGGIKGQKAKTHMRTLSDNYAYNFNHQNVFYTGTNTLDKDTSKIHSKSKEKKKQKTYDYRNSMNSPKFQISKKKGKYISEYKISYYVYFYIFYS